mmetsp:Transcript_23730/g.67387  ORF Transcript_23730/g.67387 Transcript_23730/m.67387 type:complete len:331 (-) Transcript_23730:1258-2250(-)
MSFESHHSSSRGEVPHNHELVLATGHDVTAGRAKIERVHAAEVAAEQAHTLAGVHVPHAKRLVARAGPNIVAVRVPAHAVDVREMAAEEPQRLAVVHAPQPRHVVVRPGAKVVPSRRKLDVPHWANRPAAKGKHVPPRPLAHLAPSPGSPLILLPLLLSHSPACAIAFVNVHRGARAIPSASASRSVRTAAATCEAAICLRRVLILVLVIRSLRHQVRKVHPQPHASVFARSQDTAPVRGYTARVDRACVANQILANRLAVRLRLAKRHGRRPIYLLAFFALDAFSFVLIASALTIRALAPGFAGAARRARGPIAAPPALRLGRVRTGRR